MLRRAARSGGNKLVLRMVKVWGGSGQGMPQLKGPKPKGKKRKQKNLKQRTHREKARVILHDIIDTAFGCRPMGMRTRRVTSTTAEIGTTRW